MSTEAILSRVTGAIDGLILAAEPFHGLFPSILDRGSLTMLAEMPPLIEGQRVTDRAFRGSNLIHDEVTLFTMYALARDGYAAAADRYIDRFANHCTGTVSGLFPWGEHAYWNLDEDAPGCGYKLKDPTSTMGLTHDHLRAIPLWNWEKLHAANPQCAARFGEGLDQHWRPGPPRRYIRHAFINDMVPWEPNPKGSRSSCDFPRHGGFYIFDWAFAYSVTARTDFLDRIREMLDYWWPMRRDDGLLMLQSQVRPEITRHYGLIAPGQTLSLASSLLEAADLLEETEAGLAETMRERARVYVDGFLAAPHDVERGVFIDTFKETEPPGNHAMAVWGSKYGKWPSAYVALVCTCIFRLTADRRLLSWAEAVGREYLRHPFPVDEQVPAMDAGMGLGLLADLYDVTGDRTWLDGGLIRAEELTDIYFDEKPMPRGAAGIDWYDSQMGPGFLLHGLARVVLLDQSRENCPLGPDYSGR